MKGAVPECRVHTASSLAEALGYLAANPDARPLAGGTDLMVPFAAGRLPDTHFLNLWALPELRGVSVEDGRLVMGALTTFRDIRWDPRVREAFPNLVQSAWVTGAAAIQNRGTIGGNIVNASPAADTPPALLAYGAEVELTSTAGSRWVPYADFHTGYKQTLRRPDELLTRVRVPRPVDGAFHFYRKVGTRKAQAISKVCVAAYGRVEGGRVAEFRVGLGAVAPVPFRARATEAAVLAGASLDEARTALMAEIAPIDDIRSNARYRRTVAGNVLASALEELLARLG